MTEKCKDGWFKGFHVSSQKRGVFPGNYVRLARLVSSTTKYCLFRHGNCAHVIFIYDLRSIKKRVSETKLPSILLIRHVKESKETS